MKILPYSIGTKEKVIYFLLVVSLLTSCKDKMQTVNSDGDYTMELPLSFTKANDLNDGASLQYQNTFKELYVIVIDEPKTELIKALKKNSLETTYNNDLKGYSELIVDGMDASIAVEKLPDFKDTTINGLNARLLSFEGLTSGNRVYWKLAFIEGNNNYHQIMIWTKAENQKKYEKEMAAIINSFKETDKSKKK
ncbi:hypothetical protein D3C87_289400 [compost metagenome]